MCRMVSTGEEHRDPQSTRPRWPGRLMAEPLKRPSGPDWPGDGRLPLHRLPPLRSNVDPGAAEERRENEKVTKGEEQRREPSWRGASTAYAYGCVDQEHSGLLDTDCRFGATGRSSGIASNQTNNERANRRMSQCGSSSQWSTNRGELGVGGRGGGKEDDRLLLREQRQWPKRGHSTSAAAISEIVVRHRQQARHSYCTFAAAPVDSSTFLVFLSVSPPPTPTGHHV